MRKISIIHISDIHFDRNEPENQGLVLEAFFADLKSKVESLDPANTYCIISGDLVNRGNSERIFNDFYNNFIKRLNKLIPLPNIFCSPGNHDLNRKVVEDNFELHQKLVSGDFDESKFNHLIKTEDTIIKKKFHHFDHFIKNKMMTSNYNILGYSKLLVPEITLFFLNCSILSHGGYNRIEDKGLLKIETSGLNEWIHQNKGRLKILVMHHPLDYLTNFAKSEITSMLKNGIDVIISGHIHDQELNYSFVSDSQSIIKLGSPQLFSNKTDLNGYAIITFLDEKLDSVEYREWVRRQRKFMSGQNFSGTEDGVYSFNRKEITQDDVITRKLESNFNKAMRSYSKTPRWVKRKLTTSPPNSQEKEDSVEFDYINIINQPLDYQIIAAPQFGLTCFGSYLAMKAWEIGNGLWLHLNARHWTFGKYISDFEDALMDFAASLSDIQCIILDHWKNSAKDSHKILTHLKKRLPDIPIIILSNFNDNIILEGLDSEESHDGFKQLYLTELTRGELRHMVKDFNSENQIAEENRVVERLSIDLTDLNIHRTPINCIQLLIAFLNDFEDRPINRSKVFKYVLKVIFDNPGNLFYGDTLDEDNCGFILGYFCEYLLRNDKKSFTETEYLNLTKQFCEENFNTSNVVDLLQVLKNNQIIVSIGESLAFRFSYWVYYFAALRMKDSEDFKEFMLNEKHSLYFPEVVEFYTGIDGRAEDVVKLLISNLNNLSQTVRSKIGITEEIEPFRDIKWSLNETTKGLTQEQLEENIRKSKVSDEIKDIVADKHYDSIKPYTQTIHNYLEEYDVKNLMELIRSASRALRNSEFVNPNSREELLKSISSAWKSLMRALYLIAPVLAKNGFGGVGGARFQLSEDFPKEYNECLKSIIVSMPFNIQFWFSADLFSDKLRMLFRDHRRREEDPIVRHILILMECHARPSGWKESVMNYVSTLDKNSYYLGNLYSNLRANYKKDYMNKGEQLDTEYLIKACWAKHSTGSRKPGTGTISKVSDNILPRRNWSDDEKK